MRRLHILYCIITLAFLLGTYQGYVELWEGEDPLPVKVFPYSVKLFPEEDRQILEDGIRIRDLPELAARIEDLIS